MSVGDQYEPGPPFGFTPLGLTLTDYFAASVLNGLVREHPEYDAQELANEAYEIAYAMLRARNYE